MKNRNLLAYCLLLAYWLLADSVKAQELDLYTRMTLNQNIIKGLEPIDRKSPNSPLSLKIGIIILKNQQFIFQELGKFDNHYLSKSKLNDGEMDINFFSSESLNYSTWGKFTPKHQIEEKLVNDSFVHKNRISILQDSLKRLKEDYEFLRAKILMRDKQIESVIDHYIRLSEKVLELKMRKK